MVGGLIYGAVEEYAAKSYDNADALYQSLTANSESRSIELAVNALSGLGKLNIQEAHRRALELTSSPVVKLRGVGVLTLGRLPYAGGDTANLLAVTLMRLDEMRRTADSSDNIALAQAYGDLLSYAPSASSAIVELAELSDLEVKHAVAWVLVRHSDQTENKAWVKDTLLSLAGVPSENKGTFNHLDHCAYDLMSTSLEDVLVFIEAVIINRPYRGRGAEFKITKMLEMTFHKLYESHHDVLERVITRWFASNERRLHRAARDIIEDRITVDPEERAAPFRLSKPVLDGLHEQHVVYVVMRVLGHTMFGPQLAALVLSTVQREPCTTKLQQFATDLLCNHVLYNYPGGAGSYLSGRVKAADASGVEKSVAEAALDCANARQEARRALPPLKELQPSSQHMYLVRLARQKQQAAMMEQVEEHSVFLSLVHRAPLKYGRSFFFERDGTFSEPTPLHAFEHSVELPRGELVDPVGQAYQRLVWQSAGLEDQDEDEPGEDGSQDQDD
ncbi:hypothetical protein HC891_01890 [Candidatus Gracilibacteria bacterium]|nr:hypothetical protein [Candidatus Gracilibacteria bacterium]